MFNQNKHTTVKDYLLLTNEEEKTKKKRLKKDKKQSKYTPE